MENYFLGPHIISQYQIILGCAPGLLHKLEHSDNSDKTSFSANDFWRNDQLMPLQD